MNEIKKFIKIKMLKKEKESIIQVKLNLLCILNNIFPINLLKLLLSCREQYEYLTSISFLHNSILKIHKYTKTDFINEIPFFFYKSVINQVN